MALIHTIRSRSFGEVTFRASQPGAYVFVGLHGRAADRQACRRGNINGGRALSAPHDFGRTEAAVDALFARQCKAWWRAYLAQRRAAP